MKKKKKQTQPNRTQIGIQNNCRHNNFLIIMIPR